NAPHRLMPPCCRGRSPRGRWWERSGLLARCVRLRAPRLGPSPLGRAPAPALPAPTVALGGTAAMLRAAQPCALSVVRRAAPRRTSLQGRPLARREGGLAGGGRASAVRLLVQTIRGLVEAGTVGSTAGWDPFQQSP